MKSDPSPKEGGGTVCVIGISILEEVLGTSVVLVRGHLVTLVFCNQQIDSRTLTSLMITT